MSQFIVLAVAFAALGGCGQRGPLTLPEESAVQTPAPEESAGNDETTDDESQSDD